MAKLSAQEIIDAIKELTVLELNDLVKACEEEFGVSAAANMVIATGGGEAEAAEENFAGAIEGWVQTRHPALSFYGIWGQL